MTIVQSFPVLPTRKQTKFLLCSGILTFYVLYQQVLFFERIRFDQDVLESTTELKSSKKTTPSNAIHISSLDKERTSSVETFTNSQSVRDRIRPLFSSHTWRRQQYSVDDYSSDFGVVPVLEHNSTDSPYFEVPFVTDHRHLSTTKNDNDKMYTITVFTQVSVNKLPRVKDIVQRWRAPVSCAVYLSTEQDMETFIDFLEQQQQQQHLDEGTSWTSFVAFHVMVEPHTEKKQYPINILRNLALKHVQTDYVFLLDVDFVPSVGAHDRIARIMKSIEDQEHQQQQAQNNSRNNNPVSRHAKTMYILPAFEQFPENGTNTVNDVSTVPSTKKELVHAIEQNRVDRFHKDKGGHFSTKYHKWFSLTNTSTGNKLYRVKYEIVHFEPYVVARKDYLPLFSPIYRGYGFNKACWFVECVLRDFKFRVLPDDFVVHMNHPYGERDDTKLGYYNEKFSQYLKKVYGREKFERLILPHNHPQNKPWFRE